MVKTLVFLFQSLQNNIKHLKNQEELIRTFEAKS